MMDLKWIDIHKIVVDHRNQTQTFKMKDLESSIRLYLHLKYCSSCESSRRCHEECEVCDDMFEVLERIGIER